MDSVANIILSVSFALLMLVCACFMAGWGLKELYEWARREGFLAAMKERRAKRRERRKWRRERRLQT